MTVNRRSFLHHASATLAAGWLVPFARAAEGAGAAGTPLALGRFEDVDQYQHAHALRDGAQPSTPPPSEQRDIVVVGGGLSGLIGAWRLRHHDVMVLDKEPVPGGNSRSGEIAGCRYSIGAFLSQGPVAPFNDFFAEVGADFLRLEHDDHAISFGTRMIHDPLGRGIDQLPWSEGDRVALRGALSRLQRLLDAQGGISFPMAANSPAVRELDTRTQWAQYSLERLPQPVRNLFDVLLSARIGDSGEHLSAWYGNYLLANLLADSYTMRGGHGDLSARLVQRLQQHRPGSLRSRFTVLRVENRGAHEAHVSGIDADGQPRTIAARCVLVSTPKHLAKHLVPGLRSTRAEAYAALRYNAYLVAQVSLRRRADLPFETVLPDAKLAKFVVAPDALPGNRRSDGRGLLTVYAPFPRVDGRVALLGVEAQALATQIATDLQACLPHAGIAVDEIVLQRWGHPMLTATPGMGDALETAQQSEGRIAFAHSDKLGLTGLYSAVWAGMEAEADAEVILS